MFTFLLLQNIIKNLLGQLINCHDSWFSKCKQNYFNFNIYPTSIISSCPPGLAVRGNYICMKFVFLAARGNNICMKILFL